MKDWKEYRLDELYVFGNGLSKGSKYFGYGHPFVSFKTVFNNYFLPEELVDFVDSDEKEQIKCSVQKSDVLLTRTSETVNELGYSCVALKDYPQATFNGFCKRMRPITEGVIHDLFAGYYFRSSYFRNQICSMSNMVTRASLSNEMLGRLTIKLPSYKTQHRIGEILYSIDRKIALNSQINDNLEQQAQALYKSWFVDFEPFNDGEFIDSEFGLIPQGWRIGELSEIINITSGKRPITKSDYPTRTDNVPIIGASGIMAYTKDKLYDTPILLIGRVGTLGIVQKISSEVWPSDNTLVISSNNYHYVYFNLKNIDYQAINRGSTQPLITQSDIKQQKILIPTHEVLIKFEEYANTLDKSIKNNNLATHDLVQLRNTILPKLMSGELKINDLDC